MCGLTGLIDTSNAGFLTKDPDLLKGLMFINSLRGNSSTGLMGINKRKQADIYKVLGNPYRLMDYGLFYRFAETMVDDYWAVFAHGRFPTIGETTIKNAHPFEHKHITLMHNGTLKNHQKLNEKYKKDFAVDSELLCWLVSEIGIKEAIKEIEGAYAVIYFDSEEDSINILRNYERPLWMGTNSFNDRLTFGSEKHYLKWADEKGPILKDIKEVPVNRLITIKRKETKLDISEEDCSKYDYSKSYYGSDWNEGESFYEIGTHSRHSRIPRYDSGFKSPPPTKTRTNKYTYGKVIVCDSEDVKFLVTKVTSVKVVGEDPISLIEGHHEDCPLIAVHTESRISSDVIESLLKKGGNICMQGKVKQIYVSNDGKDVGARLIVDGVYFVPETPTTVIHPASAMLRSGETLTKAKFTELARSGCFICGNGVSFVNATKCSMISNTQDSEKHLVCENCHEPQKEIKDETKQQPTMH